MLTLIKDWIKTATEEEVLELQKISKQYTPHDVIIRKVIAYLNGGHIFAAVHWVSNIKNITLYEAKTIVDEIKHNY